MKAGTTLFVIEQKPYQLALEQAQAEKASADASVKQSSADLERQQTLVKKGFATPQDLDKSAAAADADLAKQKQSQADIEQAELNLSYTEVKAPFNGVATARQVSLGQLVGAGGQSELATVVQLNPIYVNFSVSEKEVLRIKAEMVKRGITVADLKKLPVEVGLADRDGLSAQGHARLYLPDVTPRPARSRCGPCCQMPTATCCRIFRPCARAARRQPDMLLVPDRRSAAIRAGVICWSPARTISSSSAPSRSASRSASLRVIHPASSRTTGSSFPGCCRAVPGQKIDPQLKTLGAGGSRRRQPMISKFFIDRPVFANVIAILTVVFGVVALIRLPVAQYPNVVPPTVQVTTRYPGASASTVVDTVALPIEQQVNGVENMIYMQSYAAADGSYSLTVTFAIGTDLDAAQVLVQNRVSAALAALPQSVQVQGVNVQKKSTAILEIVTLTSPDDTLRQPLSQQLRHDPAQGRDRAAARRRQRHGVRRRPVFDARLARSGQDAGARPDRPGRHPGAAAAERAGHRRPGRRAAGARRAELPVHDRRARAASTIPDEFGEVIVKTGGAGDITRVRDVGRVELGAQTYGQFFNLDGKPGRRHRDLPVAGRQRARRGRARSTRRMTELSQGFPAGHGLRRSRSTRRCSSASRSTRSTRR